MLLNCVCSTLSLLQGGLKAVMWTDAFQMVIIFAGILALSIKTTVEVGGFNFVWETARKADKLHADK